MLRYLLLLAFVVSNSYARIEDNSFLLEEAFNQEWGVYQFIQKYQTSENGGFDYIFENEIPLTDKTHQLSYSITTSKMESGRTTTIGDTSLNYRWQPLNKDGMLLAERFGVVIPTGSINEGSGTGSYGFEFMQAASLTVRDNFMAHFNFGFSVRPGMRSEVSDKRRTSSAFTAGSSIVYLWRDNFNFLLEGLLESGQDINPDGSKRPSTTFTLNPGMRFGWDFEWKDMQVVPGLSFPVELLNSPTEAGVLFYLSFEPKFY